MKKRIFALALAAVMAFSLLACTAPAAEVTPTPSVAPSAEPSAALEVDLTQDIITYAAGISPDEALLTVNGEDVDAATYLYWLMSNCSYYAAYGLTPDLYGDMIKSEITTMVAYYSMLDDKALELGSPLTEEQQSEIAGSLADVAVEAESLYGLDEEKLTAIQSLSFFYENVYNAAVPQPADEELTSYVYQAKHILICTAAEGTDGTVTLTTGAAALNEDGSAFTGTAAEYNVAALAKAESILEQIRSAADPIATFDALMNEHSEDGRDTEGNLSAPDGYTTTLGQMVPEFEEGTLALAVGEISGLIQSDYGYHIILRGEVDDYASYAETYREDKMNELVTGWLESADIVESEFVQNMNVAEIYTRYTEYQTAKAAELYPTETE